MIASLAILLVKLRVPGSAAGKHQRILDRRSALAFAVTLLVVAVIVSAFHDRFWWPPDTGSYAHVAERILAGETLHRDVQDLHAGYIGFANAAAFALFGVRLVSLRYPIAFLTLVQAGIIFLLLRPRGLLPAAVGAVALTSLGFIQFLDPSAIWYCLFLAVATVAWLHWVPPGRRYRDLGTGFLVGSTFFFRQLSGVLLGIGVLAYLLLESSPTAGKPRRAAARGILLVLAAGLAGYLVKATDLVGLLLFGVWPFPILALTWRRTTASSRTVGASLASLGAGALLAAVPLIAYHLERGAVGGWVRDSLGAAVYSSRLDFMHQFQGYAVMGYLALRGLLVGDAAARVNGVFWVGLLLLTAVLAVVLLRSLSGDGARANLHPLPVIALFYAVGSLHYQIPIYLFSTIGLSLVALLWETVPDGKKSRAPALWSAAAVVAVALYYHAAMPLSRGLRGTVAGERRATATSLGLDRAGLYVEAEDAARYREVVALIQRETQPGDTIFALPSNAELYFLAERTNPFRFYNSAVGIRSAEELDSALHLIDCHPPALVFYNPGDKYNTAAAERIMSLVRARYQPPTELPPWTVFRRSDGGSEIERDPRACGPVGRP